jgi:hypothetical protein
MTILWEYFNILYWLPKYILFNAIYTDLDFASNLDKKHKIQNMDFAPSKMRIKQKPMLNYKPDLNISNNA